MGNSSQQIALWGDRESFLFCMTIDFRDTLQPKAQSASHLFSAHQRTGSLDLAMPSQRGEMSFKCHWWCPDWHRDTAASQFTSPISQTTKDVSQIKATAAVTAAAETILQKWECSYICLVFLLLSHMNKILGFCSAFSFPLAFICFSLPLHIA